ncbi:hypothetical protein FJZ36_05240 [Candidatus Poribacteria bacterium]|nr:hypothetical protein [Candidatus Poribacteria bacterium]
MQDHRVVTMIVAAVLCVGFAAASAAQVTSATDATQAPLASIEARRTSPGMAFLMSGIVPGSGQLYHGQRRGVVYLAAEVGLAVGYLLIHRDAQDLQDQYVAEVRANVKFDGEGSFDEWNMEDFEHATMFDNWHNVYTDDGGEPLERVGKFYWKDREDFRSADPQSRQPIPASDLRLVALDYRNRSNDRFQTARNVVGVILFNHIVSGVDAMVASRLRNRPANLTLTPRSDSSRRAYGVALNASF